MHVCVLHAVDMAHTCMTQRPCKVGLKLGAPAAECITSHHPLPQEPKGWPLPGIGVHGAEPSPVPTVPCHRMTIAARGGVQPFFPTPLSLPAPIPILQDQTAACPMLCGSQHSPCQQNAAHKAELQHHRVSMGAHPHHGKVTSEEHRAGYEGIAAPVYIAAPCAALEW